MNWPHLRPGDITGVLFVVVLVGIVVLLLLLFRGLRRNENFGFGPEWQCTQMEQGDPICVRLVDNDTPNKDAPR
ncbi:MAG: hypothetical protein EOQ40_20080 [Mesorhizobium sp.]|uniref:hypothetical protein n=1 Tax=Mesorhizobium sp. TaxID=1871066 RepID=UPI000FE618DB|nr:hypothetical protein [Mesorhizobium sp.]RWB19350.1 MAG: hypothetical protein EOQ40_20080 [Mesorhizobium sp.]